MRRRRTRMGSCTSRTVARTPSGEYLSTRRSIYLCTKHVVAEREGVPRSWCPLPQGLLLRRVTGIEERRAWWDCK
jgi:hypothetical protein